MVRIAHIADTHIRNLKYHEEYRNAFSHLYEILTEKKVDYIVHCGDIAHTKTQISLAKIGLFEFRFLKAGINWCAN